MTEAEKLLGELLTWATDRGPGSLANRGFVGEALAGFLSAQETVQEIIDYARATGRIKI